MLNSISILAALVTLQLPLQALSQVDKRALEIDNSIEPNVAPKPRQRLAKFVRISEAPPKIVHRDGGGRFELTCEAMGMPAPSIQWLKNGEPLSDFDEATNNIMSSHPSSLGRLTTTLILASAAHGDGDVYTCVATSAGNQDVASTTVFGNPEENPAELLHDLYMPSAPRITTFYNEIIQEIGSDVLLLCRVHSNTKAHVFWQHNEEILYDSPRIRMLPSGDLLVTSLRWSDMGMFTCNVRNGFGKDSASTFLYPAKKKLPRPA